MTDITYYIAIQLYQRWYFYIPASHGPPGHPLSAGSICVGPYSTEEECNRQALVANQANYSRSERT